MHNFVISFLSALACAAAAVLFSKDATSAAVPTAVVTTAETVAAVGAAQPLVVATGKANVKGFLTLTIGTNTTAVTVRLYRGTTAAGTLISTAIAQAGNFTAGSPAQFMAQATDVLTNVGTAQYCLTVQQTGASANGSITTAVIETEVLSG